MKSSYPIQNDSFNIQNATPELVTHFLIFYFQAFKVSIIWSRSLSSTNAKKIIIIMVAMPSRLNFANIMSKHNITCMGENNARKY